MAEAKSLNASVLEQNFRLLTFAFAFNMVILTPLVVASTILSPDHAYIGNGIFYTVTCVANLFLAAPALAALGSKRTLIFGQCCYVAFIVSFAIVVHFQMSSSVTAIIWYGGAVVGGIAGGTVWTAQGSYFSNTAILLSSITDKPKDVVTSELSGSFAFVFLVTEVLTKISWSLLQQLGVPPGLVAFVYAAIAAAAACATTRIFDMDELQLAMEHGMDVPAPQARSGQALFAAIALWRDPVIWLLAPTNFCFGFSAALMNGYVNATYALPELGRTWVACLAAFTVTVSAICAKIFGGVAASRGPLLVVSLGAVAFFSIPLSLQLGCCSGWGWFVLLLYGFQGMGRAVYESTNRALFATFFPKNSEGAFANCMLQSSVAFAACFFLQASMGGALLALVIAVLAPLTAIGVAAAQALRAKAPGRVPPNDKANEEHPYHALDET